MEELTDSSFIFLDFQQTKQRNTKRSSTVWNYFLRDVNGKVAKCKVSDCNKILKIADGSTSGLRGHLQSTHKDIYNNLKNCQAGEQSEENNSPATSIKKIKSNVGGNQRVQKTGTGGDDCSKDSSVTNTSRIKKEKPVTKKASCTKYVSIGSKEEVSTKSVWHYFLKGEDGGSAKCRSKVCQKIVKTPGGSTSGLNDHLKSKHNIDLTKRDRSKSEMKQHEAPSRSILIQDPPKVNFRDMASDITTCKDMIWRLSNRVCTLETEIKNLKSFILNKVDKDTVENISSPYSPTINTAATKVTIEEEPDFTIVVKEEAVEEFDYDSDIGALNMEMTDNVEELQFSKSQGMNSDSSCSEDNEKNDEDYSPRSKKSRGRKKKTSPRNRNRNRKGSAQSASCVENPFVVDILESESENEVTDSEEHSGAESNSRETDISRTILLFGRENIFSSKGTDIEKTKRTLDRENSLSVKRKKLKS